MELSVKIVVEFENVHGEYHTDEIADDFCRSIWCPHLLSASLHAFVPSK